MVTKVISELKSISRLKIFQETGPRAHKGAKHSATTQHQSYRSATAATSDRNVQETRRLVQKELG